MCFVCRQQLFETLPMHILVLILFASKMDLHFLLLIFSCNCYWLESAFFRVILSFSNNYCNVFCAIVHGLKVLFFVISCRDLLYWVLGTIATRTSLKPRLAAFGSIEKTGSRRLREIGRVTAR